MRIALIGYGKMGKTIEKLAVEKGHEVVARIDIGDAVSNHLNGAEVAIEFTHPEAAIGNMLSCFKSNIPVVVGTTGWYGQFEEIKKAANEQQASLFYATNFSLGVNIFFELNKVLAGLMNGQPEYEPEMEEIHHIQKKDAPSGTAITLAEGLIKYLDRKKQWVSQDANHKPVKSAFDLSIVSVREDEVPGTHTVNYRSNVDEIMITHKAFNRNGFALGAIEAAQWLIGKKGIYTMSDMLGYTR